MNITKSYKNVDGTEQYTVEFNVSLGGTFHSAHFDVPGVASWDEPDEQSVLRLLNVAIQSKAATLAAMEGDSNAAPAPASPGAPGGCVSPGSS